MGQRALDADVIIMGGGPSGASLGTFLARDGHKVLILEKDIHARDHVGESLTPSTNLVFEMLGFLGKMNDHGFIHKPGTAWNAPRSALWKFVEIWLFEFPLPGTPQPYTYNVERDEMDTLLLRHAHDNGVRVLEGVKVSTVLFEGNRAVGVRAHVADGWERDLFARYVVDATGRRCQLATQLRLKRRDPNFNQFCIYSWFRGVKEPPERLRGCALFYFIGLNQAWSWHIPLKGGKASMGVVVDKADFQKSGKSEEDFFFSLVARNRTFSHAMQGAERIRPWWVEGDYSYKIDRYGGPGWLLVGDALRFVDPIFSSGVDVVLFSSLYAYETLTEALRTGNQQRPGPAGCWTRCGSPTTRPSRIPPTSFGLGPLIRTRQTCLGAPSAWASSTTRLRTGRTCAGSVAPGARPLRKRGSSRRSDRPGGLGSRPPSADGPKPEDCMDESFSLRYAVASSGGPALPSDGTYRPRAAATLSD